MKQHKTIKKEIQKVLKLIEEGNKGENVFVNFGKLTHKQVEKIEKETGIDVSDYSRIVDLSTISHVINVHFNENDNKHISLTYSDILNIPKLLKGAKIVDYRVPIIGKPTITWEIEENGYFYYIEEVRSRKRRKKIALKTMYKRNVENRKYTQK